MGLRRLGLPIVATALLVEVLAVGTGKAAVTIGGSFTLEAPGGTTVTDRTYQGRWVLVYFGYTSCPDSCPTALVAIGGAMRALGPDAERLKPLFITIDPRRDTAAVLADYLGSFDPRIVGLTGTPAAIEAAVRAYGAYAIGRGADPEAGRFDHSTYIYLMDPRGGFVRAFDPAWSGDRIATAVRAAMATFEGPRAAATP